MNRYKFTSRHGQTFARYLRKTDPSAAGFASAYIYPLYKDAAYDYMNDEYRIDKTGYIMLKI